MVNLMSASASPPIPPAEQPGLTFVVKAGEITIKVDRSYGSPMPWCRWLWSAARTIDYGTEFITGWSLTRKAGERRARKSAEGWAS